MSADSLAAAPRLCNSVNDRLSHLFLISIQHFYQPQTPKTAIFIHQLRALVGLSYAACSVAEQHWESYQIPFQRFIQHSHGDFRYHWGAQLLLAQSLAKMVILTIESFYLLDYPNYYHTFIQTLGQILANESIALANKTEEARQLLHMFQNHTSI